MSRIVPAEEFDLIEQVISEHPEGIGISALEKALALHFTKALNRRTLQRRLERLLADKRIATEGESIALVYKRAPQRGHRRGAFNRRRSGSLRPGFTGRRHYPRSRATTADAA